jgi:HlyD family secretion protein
MLYKLLLPLVAAVSLAFAVRHVVVADQEPPKLPPPVEPSRSPYRGPVAGAGVLEALTENIAVGSPLPGVVAEVFVRVGQDVKAGDPLFRLDDRSLKAELGARQATLASAQAALKKLEDQPRVEEKPIAEAKVQEARALLIDAREQYDRAAQGSRSGAVTEDELFRRRNAVTTAAATLARAEAEQRLLLAGSWKAERDVAAAQVALAQAQVEQTMTELDRLRVTAPVTGRVLQKNVRVGEYVGVPPGQALMVLGDVSRLHVRMDVDENDIGRFRPDAAGKAITRGANKRELPLEFVRVEPYVVPKRALTGTGSERVDTRVLQIIYRVEVADPTLYVGQQVDVYLDGGT